jgi:NAD(P)-dependent dehydrogenase (short-subunit alcohol dehydrogenase family)
MLTKTAAAEYAKQGIRFNAILPGPILTGITANLPKEYIDAIEKATPIGRMGQPEEVAHLALFLASEDSSYITGASILIDGGYTVL